MKHYVAVTVMEKSNSRRTAKYKVKIVRQKRISHLKFWSCSALAKATMDFTGKRKEKGTNEHAVEARNVHIHDTKTLCWEA